MALNTVRLYNIRKLVNSIFHDSNNAAFSAGIRACFHAAFVGIAQLRKPGMHAGARCLCLHVDVPDRSCVMVACIRVKLEFVLRTSGV
jgi:hypothetical protein